MNNQANFNPLYKISNIYTYFNSHFKISNIHSDLIHFVKFRIFTLISVSFINFRINTSISIHITRRLKTWYIRILWLLYIDKLDKFIFQKKGWKLFIQSITEQQFVEFAKILPPDWLKKILIIHFVGINKLNVFAGYLPTEN